MQQKTKVYTLTPKQKEAWALLENPQYRRYLFDGGARSGKTDGTIAWLVYQACRFPGARILIARLHLDHARTTIWNLTLKKILPAGCNGARYLEGPLECRFPNGSVIRIGGLDDADDAVGKLVKAAMGRMVDRDAFAAWRAPIDTAIREAFGDLDPDSETLVEDFRAKAPAFLEALPGLMDAFSADEFISAMQGSLTAAFLNGVLPADFWKRRRRAN